MNEIDFTSILLKTVPMGILVINDRLDIVYRNYEGMKFVERFGSPGEVLIISGRIFEASRLSKMAELFPGEVYIEKTFAESTSRWLFNLQLIEMPQLFVVVFIIEDAVSNWLNMNEIRTKHSLTRRETDVLRRVIKGLKNRDVAEDLGISEQTVKDHLSSIYGKLGIERRNDLMRFFMRS